MSRRDTKRNAGYGRGDDPIDWSAFEEEDSWQGPVSGSTALRIVSLLMIVAGIAAVIWGVNSFGAELEQIDETGRMASLSPLLVAIAGALAIIPAAFGLQLAGNPVSFVPPTVFGLVGIALCAVMTVVSIGQTVAGGSAPILAWAVGLVLAFAYLFFVVRVHKAANAARARRGARSGARRPSKDELWDEKNIWR